MIRCVHLYGHTSAAQASLCSAVVAAHPFVRAFYPREDLNGPRYATRAFEALTRGDDAAMRAAERDLLAFVERARASTVVGDNAPARGQAMSARGCDCGRSPGEGHALACALVWGVRW